MAPPQSTTSPARTCCGAPPRFVYSTPTARVPSNRIRVTKARVVTSRFGRLMTGCRYARAAESLRPRWTLRSKGAKPSWRSPFTSVVSGYPASCTASKKAPNSGFVAGPRSRISGPLRPRYSSLAGEASVVSIRLK
jgi:hypothetical protein